jgi:lipoic acid synthetase
MPERLPAWLRRPLRTDPAFGRVSGLLKDLDLHTVCRSARCPNRHECWNAGTATFLVLGGVCTRACRFCAVPAGRPAPPDPGEPARVAEAALRMGLRHVVVTSVTRDDLPDGGAGHFAAVLRALRGAVPEAGLEVLVPDFGGRAASVTAVLEAGPDVFNHNLETVRRLQASVRPQAGYDRSLGVLRAAAAHRPAVRVKSGLMLGMGETDAELDGALADLRAAGCGFLTLGQYLAPSRDAWPVRRHLPPEAFAAWARRARALGFAGVEAGPLVRSSYRAEEMVRAAV